MIGRTYLERGEPVTVLVRWNGMAKGRPAPPVTVARPAGRKPHGPMNVLIRRPDGELVVRTFRGLRRPR